jgi:hypothetical protein
MLSCIPGSIRDEEQCGLPFFSKEADSMPAKHQHTWQQYHVGHIILTVQLDSVATGTSMQRHQDLAGVTRRLIAIADAQRLPVTWSVSDPAHSAATSLIVRSAVDHELAILGDANWVGPTAGRTRFARELVRRVTQARGTGLEVSSLVPHVASIEKHIDLVVKHGITAVAGCEAPESNRQLPSPRALHYGVWELPVTEILPLQSKRIFGRKWATWNRIRRAAREAGTFHVMIDAPAVAESGRSAEKMIAWLAKRVALLRDRGLVRVETLRSMAARLSDVPAVRPQRSILRAAA